MRQTPGSNGIRRSCLYTITALLLLDSVAAAADWTPISIGTAGAGMAISTGLDGALENPAHLGREPGSAEFRVVGFAAGLSSNGLGWSDYNRYNGATLNDGDKQELLSKIPNEGFRLLADANATAMAVRVGSWSFYTSGTGSGRGQLDRDAVELLLYGNATQPEWEFNNSEAEGLAAWSMSLSHGRPIGQMFGRTLYAGAALSYVRGLYYAQSQGTAANLKTELGGLTGNARSDWLTAEGGSGWGLDLGLAMDAWPQWTLSVKLKNLVHHIRWNTNAQVTHYGLEFDDLTVDNFDDSLWVAEETRETLSGFTQGLPAELHLGIGHNGARVRTAASLSMAVATRFASASTPRLAAGLEYWLSSAVPLRCGAAVGGASGFAAGWGAGLRLGIVTLNAGFRMDKALWLGRGNGLTGALALDMKL